MRTLYCLKLEKGRYYVGETPKGRFERRLWEHDHGGAKWTTRFPVQGVVWTREVADGDIEREEDAANVAIMKRRGKNSCRGGSFNIGRDVYAMPRWAKDVYRNSWAQIEASSGWG